MKFMIFYLSKAVVSLIIFAASLGFLLHFLGKLKLNSGIISSVINVLAFVLCGLVALFSGLNGFANFIKALLRLFV